MRQSRVRLDPLRHRLRVQGLSGAPFTAAGQVVHWLGAMQSQEYAVAKWSIAQRSRGVDEARVDQAIADGDILRTHMLRPTWHFVSAADIRWIQRLTAPRVRAALASYDRKLELDSTVLSRGHSAIAAALAGGRHLTRTELAAALLDAGIHARGQRLAHLVMHAELDALICSGTPRGKSQTYALLEERVPSTAPLERDAALAALAIRYFASRGPATVRDLRWWSSLTSADARRAIEAAGAALARREIAGRTCHLVEADTLPRPRRAAAAHLIQIYDELVVGYSESRDLLSADPGSAPAMPIGANVVHAVLLHGKIVGGWRRLVKRDSIEIAVRLTAKPDRSARIAVEEALQRYRDFSAIRVTVAAGHSSIS